MCEVAIIGVGCRLPGADNVDEFWKILRNGENHVIEVPPNRWNLEAFYDSDPDVPGKTHVRRAGFVDGHDKWDFKVYGVNEFEALKMDPQHKFVLDSTFMALENAGISKQQISGSNTGVYIGMSGSDYGNIFSTVVEESDNYTLTGNSNSIVAARVSYVFNLIGPSMMIDTACSSSLVSIHQACQALRSGECDLAIAGGVNSLMKPDIFIQLSKARMVSPTGQCQAFSENADGYARGEGCGIIILKPLEQALKDNDNIWATIVTAVNHDGQTVTPITAPSPQQQESLLNTVFDRYRIDPESVDYIEAHGTGTKAGDPAEVTALGKFFEKDKNPKQRLIGSVKTNIGHLESGAGVAGLIKVLLMHKHQEIVPSLHFDKPSENVPLDKYNLKVPTKVQQWPKNDNGYMRSCVNSFSFGGTNSHAIITTPMNPSNEPEKYDTSISQLPRIVCLSACDRTSLQKIKSHFCNTGEGCNIEDVSYTTMYRRNHFPFRIAVIGTNMKQVIQRLNEIDLKDEHSIDAVSKKKKKIIFVFAGMGTNWKGMCQSLLKHSAIFRGTINDVSDILKQFILWDLCDAFENGFDLDDPYVAPIMTFACEIGVYAMMKEFGVVADAIVGQSIGEVAAAYASGTLTLNQAVCVIYHRTKYQAEATGGKMFIVRNMEIADVKSLIETFETQANISLFYSPSCCTISCDDEVIDLIKSRLKETERSVEFIDLNVTSAFHSHHMDDCTEKLTTAFTLHGTPPITPIVSSVSGKMAVDADFITSEYWAKNIRNPVLFHQSIVEVHEPDKMNIFIEIGPKPVLKAHIAKIFEEPFVALVIPTIQKDDDIISIIKAVATLYENGVNIKWEDVLKCSGKIVEVPQYQFSRIQNCYIPNVARETLRGFNSKTNRHPFLKSFGSDSRNYKVLLDPSRIASIYEHKVDEIVVVPGAVYAEVGIAIAATKSSRLTSQEISVDFKYPLVLNNRESKELDVETEDINQEIQFRIFEGTTVYASGTINTITGSVVDSLDLDEIRGRCKSLLSSEDMYAALASYKFKYGQAMTILQGGVKNNKEALVELRLNKLLKEEMEGTILHPAITDGLLQTPVAFVSNNDDVTLFPVHLNRIRVLREVQDRMFCYVKILKIKQTKRTFLIHLCAENGEIVASILKYTVKALDINREEEYKDYFYKQQWKKVCLVNHPVAGNNTDITFIGTQRHLGECPLLTIPENNEQRKELLANFSTKIKKHKNIAIMMDEFKDQIIDGRDIQTSVERKLLWLKDILIHIHKNTENCRVLVITRNTWMVTTDKSNCVEISNCNTIPFAIWGFLRSVQREPMSFKLHIVDLNDYNDQISRTGILEFLFNGFSSNLENHGEILVTADAVFSLECASFAELNDYIERDQSSFGDFEMFSSQKNRIENTFKMYPCHKGGNANSNTVVMQVASLVFQNADLYSSCFDSLKKEDNEEPKEFSIYCLETIGYVSKDKTDRKEKHICIYPVHASNRVEVPIHCCVPMSRLSSYHPGLMTILVTLWNICEHVTSMSVVLFCEDNTSLYEEIICSMLRYRKVKTITRVSRNTNNLTSGCELINLTRLDRNIINSHILNFSKVKRFISLSTLVAQDCVHLLYHHMQDSEIKLLTEWDIFSPQNLISTVTRTSKWLMTSTEDVNFIVKKHRPYTEDAGYLNKLFSSIEINLDQSDVPPLRLRLPDRFLTKSAAYVVVGGLTGLGWQCVKWLAENNAGSIACFNRRNPTKDVETKMEELSHKCCCKIIAIQTDVTDFISLKVSFEKLMQQFPMSPLKGVIFGAGVLRDSTLINVTDKQITEVLDAKITGAWNMHLATENIELDFFILHSSITSVFGAPGQSNYAAGNAFQDSLAFYRRSKGLPAQSINWGPLDMGMLENTNDNSRNRQSLEKGGYRLIHKEDIGHCLESAILSDLPQIIVTDLNLHVLRTTLSSHNDMFAMEKFRGIFPKPVNYTKVISDTNCEEIQVSTNNLQSATTKDRIPMIESYIFQLVCKALKLDENSVSSNTCLVDNGMDSMVAMTIVNEVNTNIRYRIPVNLLFSPETTVATLSSFINENIRSSNEVDDDDNQDDNVDNPQTISFMEYRFYKLNKDPHAYRAFHILFDMRFSDLSLDEETMTRCLLEITSRNPILRTTYSGELREGGSKEDIKRNLIDAKQALDLIIIDEDNQNIDETFEKKSMAPFDLKSKGPVRFIYHTNGSFMRIVVICNHVAFDLVAVRMLLVEFTKCLKSDYNHHSPEHRSIPTSQSNRLVGNVMDRRLKSSFGPMKNFWIRELSKGVPLISIASTKKSQLHGLAVTAHRPISRELLTELNRLSKTLRITASKIMMSMYQLFLSLRSGNRRVFITLPEDLRSSLPETNDVMECVVNHIPIFAEIEHSMSVKDFLANNSKHINYILDNSMFPYDEIVKLIPADDNKDLCRHICTINDYTFVGKLKAAKKGVPLKLKANDNNYIFGESCIFILTDQNAQTTSLKMQLSKEMYSQVDVDVFIDQMLELLHEMVFQPEVKIGQLKMAAQIGILEEDFKRETSTGGPNDVNVKFFELDNDNTRKT